MQKSREEILELATRELAEFFPAVREAKLVKATVIKEIYATYAILPGLDKYRPEAKTQWPQIFLAGDWTATGWPATMEGAVRSGYLAAEALMKSCGQRAEICCRRSAGYRIDEALLVNIFDSRCDYSHSDS